MNVVFFIDRVISSTRTCRYSYYRSGSFSPTGCFIDRVIFSTSLILLIGLTNEFIFNSYFHESIFERLIMILAGCTNFVIIGVITYTSVSLCSIVPFHQDQPIVFKFILVTLWLFDMAFGYGFWISCRRNDFAEEMTLSKERPCRRYYLDDRKNCR